MQTINPQSLRPTVRCLTPDTGRGPRNAPDSDPQQESEHLKGGRKQIIIAHSHTPNHTQKHTPTRKCAKNYEVGK